MVTGAFALHAQTALDTSVTQQNPGLTTSVVSKPVVVTASRYPQTADSVARTMVVITQEQLRAMPVHSVAEALSYIPGVDIQQRGPLGVQADIAMRGGGFEQTAVLINGMRISDVQTAHNVLAMPFVIDDIERIEVVKGGASRLYGPGAMDGAVNIILRQGKPTRIAATVVGGDFAHRQITASGSLRVDATTLSVSGQKIEHGNYRPSTDLDLFGYTAQVSTTIGSVALNGHVQMADKSFGAGLFYSPRFPDQWERTRTYNAGLHLDATLDTNWLLSIGANYRNGSDEFLLRRNDPAFYRNYHVTTTVTGQAMLRGNTSLGSTALGVEAGRDTITSTSLGGHRRGRIGGSIEHSVRIGDFLRVTAGANMIAYSDRIPGIGWGGDVAHVYSLGKVFATVNRSFRIPSYTEMFYKDPTSIGDSTLAPETAISSELGWTHALTDAMTLSISGFRRDQSNGIDYAFQGDSLPWKATNIQTTTINGLDANLTYAFSRLNPDFVVSNARFGLNLNDVKSSSPVPTRYALRQLRWQGVLETSFHLPFNASATFLVRLFERYTDRVMRSTGDARLQIPIVLGDGNPSLNIMAEVVNIWNASYIEAGFGTVAPRWFRVGISSAFQSN